MSPFPLPVRAALLLPHKAPMLCIDTLVECGETEASAVARLEEGQIFLKEDGTMDRSAFVELAAQCAGAMRGLSVLREGKETGSGFLVGAQNFTFAADARAGDELVIRVRLLSALEGVKVLEARILRDGELLARGNVKVFTPEKPLRHEADVPGSALW